MPIDDVTLGLDRNAPKPEATRESTRRRAVVWLPSAGPPEVVLLHLHGHNVGWRHDRRPDRRVARDLGRERIGAQLAGAGRAVAAVLPQGDLRSRFSPTSFDPAAYLRSLREDPAVGGGGALGAEGTPTVVSAHSGGGGRLASLLAANGGVGLPPNTVAVVLLDAINDASELSAVQKWAMGLIDVSATALAPANDEERERLIGAGPRLVVCSTASSYRVRATNLGEAVAARLRKRGQALALSPRLLALWRDRFRFEAAPHGAGHDHLVGAGDPLARVLGEVT